MHRFVIFIKKDATKVLPKEDVTSALIKKMKQQGFRKYHSVIEAENERDAIGKLNNENEEQLNSLKEFSGNAIICAICVVVIALAYLIRSL